MSEIAERIYHLKGSPKEVGFTLGRALGERLAENIDLYIQTGPAQHGFLDRNKLRNRALPWLRGLPRRFQDELEGMAEGVGIPVQRLAEWYFAEQCVDSGCTGLVCRHDSQVWVARNNDFWAPDLWGYVCIREIDGRIPTISFGLEGDVFTGTGINREQLWLHSNHLPVNDRPAPDKPHQAAFVWLTEALETCQSIEDVENLLGDMDRDGGMMLFVIDGKTNEFVIFECMCAHHFRRVTPEDWIVGTNHCCTDVGWQKRDGVYFRSELRLKRVETLLRELMTRNNTIDITLELRRILADSQVEARSGKYTTVFATVACPVRREIWYTFGGYPAASAGNWNLLAWPWW